MLFITSESPQRAQALNDVTRELSLTPAYFASADTLTQLMGGHARRIILLREADIVEDVLGTIETAAGPGEFGVIVAADREALRLSSKAELLERLTDLRNVWWIAPEFDFDLLSDAARSCRRRMLRLSRKDIEDAIVNREFLVQYQPKVERSSAAEWLTREAEALVRWRHPQHGFVGPLEFLPEVEAFDLMGSISEFVLREAASQLQKWEQQGLVLNSCINLASSLLSDASLAEQYEDIVTSFGFECSRFTFEIAEQELADPEAPHLRALAALRDRGFRLCLDDFRVAAASLGTFEQLPFDEIKIHASALKRAQKDPVKRTILAAVTGLAHNLGMSVCAEGVEDDATFEFLKTIECDKMQGFLISEAVMPDIMRRVYGPGHGVGEVA
ncbi:MAG: EAL domain-containing protein [Gammaproteobacteria bacterium]|nr:EAL domain-containing protein [Gammaproteobacteria bacterium]MDH3428885.1 EAL domain-containing protein [Gammaproteobacteria bacterium]